MPVDVNVIVGNCSMSKKSFVRRWPSRPSSPVSIEAIWTVAVTRRRQRVVGRDDVGA